jgi:hypothetical protein
MSGEAKIHLSNSAEALRNQDGKFKVTAPNGYIFQVTCRRGRKIRIREIGQSDPATLSGLEEWQIEQIA